MGFRYRYTETKGDIKSQKQTAFRRETGGNGLHLQQQM